MSVQDIYNKLRTAPLYHPSSAELFDDMTIEPGDIISVKSDDEYYALPVFANHLVWNGSAMMTVQSQGEQERKPIPALQRKLFSQGHGGYTWQRQAEGQFRQYEMHIVETDERFSRLATESEWDELAQAGHVTAWSQVTQTARELSSVVAKTGINELGEDETLYSEIVQNAEAITTKVGKGEISSTINQTAQSVLIQASKINLSGYVTASQLSAVEADITNLTTGQAKANKLYATTGWFDVLAFNINNSYTILKRGTMTVCNGVSTNDVIMINDASASLDHYHNVTATESGGVITIKLGRARSTEGSANFNIADTQYFQDAVSAARSEGAAGVTLSGSWGTTVVNNYNTLTINASNGARSANTMYITANSWSSGSRWVYLRSGSSTGTQRARLQVSMPSSGTWSITARTGIQYGIPIAATFTAGGKTYEYTGTI